MFKRNFSRVFALLALAIAVYQAVQLWLDFQNWMFMGTAVLHLPMAGVGTLMAFETAKRYPRFSIVCAAFVLLNAALI